MSSYDITFCTSETCKNKCDRHESKHTFDPDRLYSFCDFNSDPNVKCEWRITNGKNR